MGYHKLVEVGAIQLANNGGQIAEWDCGTVSRLAGPHDQNARLGQVVVPGQGTDSLVRQPGLADGAR